MTEGVPLIEERRRGFQLLLECGSFAVRSAGSEKIGADGKHSERGTLSEEGRATDRGHGRGSVCVKARTLIGGPAPDRVKKQLEESREALLTDQKIFEELQGQIKAGEKKMAAAEKTLLGN